MVSTRMIWILNSGAQARALLLAGELYKKNRGRQKKASASQSFQVQAPRTQGLRLRVLEIGLRNSKGLAV